MRSFKYRECFTSAAGATTNMSSFEPYARICSYSPFSLCCRFAAHSRSPFFHYLSFCGPVIIFAHLLCKFFFYVVFSKLQFSYLKYLAATNKSKQKKII